MVVRVIFKNGEVIPFGGVTTLQKKEEGLVLQIEKEKYVTVTYIDESKIYYCHVEV